MPMTYDLDQSPRRLETVIRKTIRRDLAVLPCYEVEVDGKPIRYAAAEGSGQVLARVLTLFAKEPTTIPYLETFEADDLYLDIGANIGMYTIYAAVMTGCRAVAIEPEALNYAELNKNIYLNELNDRVLGYCAAASDTQEISRLLLGGFTVGHSHHDFGESTWVSDMKWSNNVVVSKENRMQQGSISVRIDDMVASGAMELPKHIKIDVDGWEHKVIDGARTTLADPGVRSVLIELDHRFEKTNDIIEYMESLGWKYSMDQLVTNRVMVMRPERVRELRQIKKDGFNYIFYRDDAYADLFKDFLAKYTPPYDKTGRLVHNPVVVDG
jgi:FkbM family methyltransferase